jgi:arylsulfatase A-like enzyme
MGWRDPGCYGNREIETPAIDRLAAEGMKCTNAFVTASSCSPSRASFITGQYPHTHGVTAITNKFFFKQLQPFSTTLPSLLAEYGYHTTLEGKWHVAPYLPARWYGYRERIGGIALSAEDMWIAGSLRTIDFLKRNRDRRFYLEINYMNNHRNAYGDIIPDEDFPVDPEDVSVPDYWALPQWPEIRRDVAHFYSQTMKMDKMIGEVLRALDELDIAENTLVCFVSDNGPQFPGHIMALYDRGIGTPLIFRWPERISPGSVYDGLVSTVDLMPTFLEACGVPIPEGVEGRSLYDVITGEETGPVRDAVFAEMTHHVYYLPTRAARTERYKYIKNYSDIAVGLDQLNHKEWAHRLCELPNQPWKRPRVPEELYDLAVDPNEQRNLVDDSSYREVLSDMRLLLEAHMKATGDPFLGAPFTDDYEDNLHIITPTEPGEKAF